jgi:hypothetical protein
MKITTTALSLLSIFAGVVAQGCDYETPFHACDVATILEKTSCTAEELVVKFGLDDTSALNAFVQSECISVRAQIKEDMLPWDSVTRRGKQFDDSFFDGGSIFNTQDHRLVTGFTTETDPDTQRLKDISSVVLTSGGIAWPDSYIKNFDLVESCDSQTVMCCWTATRNGVSADIPEDEANTNVCTHDIGDSPKSARVEDGESIFPGNGEGNTVCHGFFWDDFNSDYKGNLLFKVAMADGLMGKGYVRNIPSAPMCACIEQMPTVTYAGCTDMNVTETFKISHNELQDRYHIVPDGEPDITFNACEGKDLKEAYESANMEGTTERQLKKITGGDDESCDALASTKLADFGYIPRNSDQIWKPVAGRGLLAYPIVSAEEFREIWAGSETKILRRKCLECDLSHMEIYYKRINDIDGELPANFDLLHTVLDSWAESDKNRLGETFELYSSYDDALSGDRKWEYCNYHSHIGFPRDCGPTEYTPSQWNRFFSGGSAKTVAFYVDYSNSTSS